ncbi:MAG: hypothetical protein JKY54_11305 [Flavobacteriales bacterium]|nr:hypothetical protein [Flavobacteriales bacterium]
MQRFLQLLFVLLFFSFTYGQFPDYTFPDLKLAQFTPKEFTDLEFLHQNNIKQVEITIEKHSVQQYVFNKEGKLIKSIHHWDEPEKRSQDGEVSFSYNTAGQLTLIKFTGDSDFLYDTLKYDDQGQIIYFASAYSYDVGSKRAYEHAFRVKYFFDKGGLRFLSTFDNLKNPKSYLLDDKNRVIKSISYNRQDSIEFRTTNDSIRSERFWVKMEKDSSYYLRHERTFNHNRLMKEVDYEKSELGARPVNKVVYNYNAKDQLISISKGNSIQLETVYTYCSKGFLIDKVLATNKHSVSSQYVYTFFE